MREEITMKKSFVAFLKGIVSVMVVLVFVVAVSGCQKEEGPMEKAGKKVDEGIQATTDAAKKAGEKVSEGAEKTKEAVKDAAEKVEDKAKQ
jgi:ABC-type Na+ efflux pump permease subunit